MIALLIISGIIFYAFGGLLIFKVCNDHWGKGCRERTYADHWNYCAHIWWSLVMGLFWPIAPPVYLMSLVLWRAVVVVSAKFAPKEDE